MAVRRASSAEPMVTGVPARDCALCPRLAAFREQNQVAYPDFVNAPVPSFGGADAELLIVGLAPGLRGANRTGRPFTGDYAGALLYATLDEFGFSTGSFGASADDGLSLRNCRITNAVRCVPPENKPTGAEVRECGRFLRDEIESLPRLRIILALGAIAHHAVLAALDLRRSSYRFTHGAVHLLPGERELADSYHCSRYNTNTGRLTADMFRAVFRDIAARLSRQA